MSSLTQVKWNGRRNTSNSTLQKNAKLILAHHKRHVRKNAFCLKLEVHVKLRLTQLKLDLRERISSLKLQRCSKFSLTHPEELTIHNTSTLNFRILKIEFNTTRTKSDREYTDCR